MQVGDQLGDYRLVREVGRGTFGVVYQAEQVYLGTQAAIKVLLNTAPEEREALLAEARKIAAWRHPHITLVLGFSEYQRLPYLVLQYAPHGTLRERYPLGQVFSIEAILPHVQQIAAGLQYAHERQTLHLDLKPANVLLDEQQAALISDFGVSVILQPDKTHQTVKKFMGTPLYAAPEQFDEERGHATAASDQYALATMVYQWLTGRLPFQGSLIALAAQKTLKDPPPLGAGVPPAVAAVVLKALATDPRARYPSVQAFVEALAGAERDLPAGTLLLTLSGHSDGVWAVAWSPDGRRLASAGFDQTVRVWDAGRGLPLGTLVGHANTVYAVAWSSDGRRLASAGGKLVVGEDNAVHLWDAKDGQPLAALVGHTSTVQAVAWSPDSRRLASASWDTTVRLWDAASSQPLGTLSGHTSWVLSVAYSPDGRRLAAASADQTMRLWSAASGMLLATLAGHTDWVWAVAWSPDGRRLASASADQTVRLWDAASGQPLATLPGHTWGVQAVAWSPDGQRLASASADQTVRVWDAASGQPLGTLADHTDTVYAVAWSPDGRCLASASADQTVRVWWVGER